MGATKLRKCLPGFIKAVREAGQVVTWISDPMHGNTETVLGYKTRRFDNIRGEIEAFFDVHEEMGSIPGGVHVEMTGGWSRGAPIMHGTLNRAQTDDRGIQASSCARDPRNCMGSYPEDRSGEVATLMPQSLWGVRE